MTDIAQLRVHHEAARISWVLAKQEAAKTEVKMNEAWLRLFEAECAADRAGLSDDR